MVDKDSIAKLVKDQLKMLYGERLAKVILYGSYARGDNQEESDIDFLVVLKDEQINIGEGIRYMNHAIFKISLDKDIIISSHPTSLKKFETSDFLFYKNVRREGVQI